MNNVLVLDTETGGLYPDINSLLEVALSPLEGGFPDFESLVYDPTGITYVQALEVNKIKREDISSFPHINDVAVELTAYLEAFAADQGIAVKDIQIAGHNVGTFDAPFMRRMFDRGLPWSHRYIDTASLLWAAAEVGLIPKKPEGMSLSSFGFTVLGATRDGEGRGRHSAMGDVMATKRMLVRLLNLFARSNG